MNSRICKTTNKYDIEVPTSIEHVKEIDARNGDTMWQDAIDKYDGKPIPVGWTKSSGHLVFDVKMDFTREARWARMAIRSPNP